MKSKSLSDENYSPYQEEATHHHGWDWWSIGLSFCCLIHCLLTPFLVVLLPLLSFEKEIHGIVLFPLLFFAAIAFFKGYRRHRKVSIIMQSIASFLILIIALFFLHGLVELITAVCGSLLLIGAHWRNIKHCHC